MYKISRFFLFFSILALLFGCSSTQKIAALKPEPDDASPLVYESATSFIKLPIKIKVKDIENQINKFLTGLVYEDAKIEDDNLCIKIWKSAPISIENENGKIKTVLPLKVYVKYRIGTDSFGMALYDTKEFNFNGKVTLLSDVNLSNWKLNTTTKLKALDWVESPSVTVLGRAIPITYLINPGVQIFKSDIEKTIDAAISKAVNFKPNVTEALEKICTPFEMNKTFETWLRIVPTELYTTDSKLQKDAISFDMGLKCTMETLIGQKPVTKFDKNKLVLKAVASMPEHISANIVAISTYGDASKIITQNFAGQEFGSGNKKVKVQDVAVWHKDGKMILALEMIGSINGTIYLSGIPQYNALTKEIYFDKLDYVLDTKSKLMRTANWLAQGLILKKIQENCRYSIQSNLDEGKQNMLAYLKNYSPIPGVIVNGKIDAIQFQKIQLTNKAIVAFISVNGDVTVAIDGLK